MLTPKKTIASVKKIVMMFGSRGIYLDGHSWLLFARSTTLL
jgi:hypothetical protein